jgi:hypothetical protein
VGEIGTKEGHLAGRPVIHVANRPLPLSPQIPYLRDAKGLTSSAQKLGRRTPLRVGLGRAFLPHLLHVL